MKELLADEKTYRNEVYFWKNFMFSAKISLMFLFIEFLAIYLFYELFLSYRLNSDQSWQFIYHSMIFTPTFFFVIFIFQIIGSLPKHGPQTIRCNDKGLLLWYFGKVIIKVAWDDIYDMSEVDVNIPESLLKYRKAKEYRVYYYKGRKSKWFCVSEEIGKMIKEELKKREMEEVEMFKKRNHIGVEKQR